MIIRTAQFRYAGPDRLDITAKGQHPFGKHFAPTWNMVWNSKKGRLSEEDYTSKYLNMISTIRIQELAETYKQITLVCYCPAGDFCHRVVLAEYMENMGIGRYIGEIPTTNLPDCTTGDLTLTGRGIICHQVNCRGKMGAGLALAVRRAYPQVYDKYMEFYHKGALRLGEPITVKVHDNLFVANLPAQDRYGRDRRYTNYAALRKCLHTMKKVRQYILDYYKVMLPIFFPYKMGCSLAGGDWYLVSKTIKSIIPDAIIIRKE